MKPIDQHEHCRTSIATGERITKWKGKVANLVPSLFVALVSTTALMVGNAQGQTLDTTTNASVIILNDQDFRVTPTGSVDVSSLSAPGLVIVDVAEYTSSLQNDGILIGTNIAPGSHAGIEVRNTLKGDVINNNRIELLSSGSANDLLRGIQAESLLGNIENNGDILIDLKGSRLGQARGIETSVIEGKLINAGKIDVKVNADSAVSTGVETGIVATHFENTGLISSVASGSSATAYGVDMSFLFGNASNSGTISVKATASSEASALGIRLVNPVFGSLINSGTITVEASAGTNPNATGLKIETIVSDGMVSNSGTVSVKAIGTGSSATSGYATGITNNHNTGNLTNSGVIDVFVENVSTAFAAGINLSTLNTDSKLANSGSITVESKGRNSASAYGVSLENTRGSLDNSGTIVARVASDTARAVGVLGLNTVSADAVIHNSGSITAIGTGRKSGLNVLGLEVGNLSGAINNSGTIQAAGQGQLSGRVTGVSVNVLAPSGSLVNSGTINVNAHIEGGEEAYTTGIGTGLSEGTIENSGNILVRSTGVAANNATIANVYGIAAQVASNKITHSGSISVESAGGTNSNAFGIFVGNHSDVLDVSGNIAVSGAEKNYGIFLGTGGGALNITSSADIDGTIRVSDHNVTLTHDGGANVYKFEDADISAGSFKTLKNVQDGAWFIKDEGGANPVYASAIGSDFQLNRLLPFQVGELSDALTRQVKASSKLGQRLSNGNESSTVGGKLTPYVSASYIRDRLGASSKSSSTDSNLGSLNAGVTQDLGGGTRYGLGLSYAKGRGEQSPNTLETEGGFFSGLIAHDMGFVDLTAGVGAGWFSHTNQRQVVGSADALGDLTSTVITGQLGVSSDFNLTNNVILTPEALVRVGQQRFGSYMETGAEANARVAGRSLTFSQVNIGATLSTQVGQGVLSASAAAVHRDLDGPGIVDLAIFDTSAALPSEVDWSGTYGEFSIGYDQSLGSNGFLSLLAQAGVGEDNQTQALSVSYKLTF